MPASSSPNRIEPAGSGSERLLGVDLARFISFYAIVIFHLSYAFWADLGHADVAVRSPWLVPFEVYARALVFSGFSVLFLSFFLFGFKKGGSRKRRWLWPVLLAFFLVWSFTAEEFPYIWDIYPYLLVTVALTAAARRWRVPPALLAFVGGVLVSIPFWRLEGVWTWPRGLEAALIGVCHGGVRAADWPLLPWLGWPLFAFGIGGLAARNRGALARMSRAEKAAWGIALIGSLPLLGGYYATPLGNEFACSVFRRPPLELWAHELWIFWIVRLSLLPSVQTALARAAVPRWISRRAINRRFFISYFVHYPLCFAAAALAAQAGVLFSPWSYIAAFTACVLATEWSTVVFSPDFRENADRGTTAWAKINARS